jgi:hypothetical protein
MSKIYEALQNKSVYPVIRDEEHREAAIAEFRNTNLNLRAEMINLSCVIESAIPQKTPKIVQFVGAVRGEGASILAREFARVCVNDLRKSIFLLHADTNAVPFEEERSNFPLLMGTANDSDRKDLLIFPLTVQQSLQTVLNGSDGPGPFTKIRERFELIIVDSPAITAFPDSLLICSKVDGVILVMEADKTPWNVTKDVKEQIVNAGGKIVAVVLNKKKDYLPRFIRRQL